MKLILLAFYLDWIIWPTKYGRTISLYLPYAHLLIPDHGAASHHQLRHTSHITIASTGDKKHCKSAKLPWHHTIGLSSGLFVFLICLHPKRWVSGLVDCPTQLICNTKDFGRGVHWTAKNQKHCTFNFIKQTILSHWQIRNVMNTVNFSIVQLLSYLSGLSCSFSWILVNACTSRSEQVRIFPKGAPQAVKCEYHFRMFLVKRNLSPEFFSIISAV